MDKKATLKGMKLVNGLSDMQNYILIQAQREIGVQILFALVSFENITKKGEGNIILTFSSIHSFLTHCANISKLLWSSQNADRNTIKIEVGKDLVDILKISQPVLLKDKTFRNDLDHYDERMIGWIKEEYPKHKISDPKRRSVSDLTIGVKDEKGGPNALHLRNYNPRDGVYTFGDRDLNLIVLRDELIKLQEELGTVGFVSQ